MENIENLIKEAKEMSRKNFCCRHSKFSVGAILVAKSGKTYNGFNIENNGILSICAERVAFCKALSEGEKEFDYIVVVGKDEDEEKFSKTLPCGYCRQFMSEYTNKDFVIYTFDDDENKIYSYKMSELLPEGFKF